MRGRERGMWMRAMAMAAVAAVVLTGCRRAPNYSQATPDDVLQSAAQMVKNGQAARLTDLIYADNPDMRGLYQRLGILFGSVQKLALTLNEKFPKEVQALKDKAVQAAKDGKATSLLAQLSGQARRSARQAREGERTNPGDAMDMAFKQLLADPYGWLNENAGKLSTTPINDEVAAVLWDGKPIMPPVGLVMKKDGPKWYVVLPTNLPGISTVIPKSKDEFAIWGSLIKTVDNAVIDLTKDVKTGKIRSLDEVSRKAGEKAFVPIGIGILAYSRAMDARKHETKKPEIKKPEEKKTDDHKPGG